MKRKFARRALSGLLSLLMVVGLLPFTAMAEGVPEYITPVYPATSDGVTVTAKQTGGDWFAPIYTITVEIDENTEAEKLDVNIAEGFADILQNASQLPGSTMTVNIEVINHSQYNYGYSDNSLVLGTAPYALSFEDNQNPDDWEKVTAFDGFTVYIGSWNDVTRSYNNALKALDIGLNSDDNSDVINALSDENLSECLEKAGYENGVADLGKYYIDYYNKTYNASIDDLKEADMDYLVNLFKCMNPEKSYGQHIDTEIRETCPEVAALGYYYLYNHLITVNDEPLATYMEKGSASLAKLSGEFQEALAVPAGETGTVILKSELSGPDTANCYQNHVLLGGLSFALEKGEAKQSFPGLDKKVGDDDEAMNDDDVDAAAGQEVNFQLTSNVPTDLLNYLNPEDVTPPSIDGEEPGAAEKVEIAGRGSYVLIFHDKLNEMLTNLENYVVKIGETVLTAEQYTLTATGLEDGCSFEIALDLAALYEAGKITDADIENATPITVTYDATLSAEAVAGEYQNEAWVTAPKWTTEKDIVYVNTYAIDIFKYDQANNTGLAGAEFELKNSEGVVISTVTSGQDGHVVIDGLDSGTYTLTETKAPDGYVKSDTPLTIIIPKDADGENVVSVSFANSQIPHTGGTGTLMFTIGGIALMGTAGLLLVISRKKRKA